MFDYVVLFYFLHHEFHYLAQEIWTTLAADGSRGPFYVSTKSEKVAEMRIFENDPSAKVALVPVIKHPTLKMNVAPGERGCLAYLQYMINEAQYMKTGDILLHDGEAALDTESVQQYLSLHGIYAFTIPSALHQFLSPCDNNFHSLLKLSYYRLISNGNYKEIGIAEKLELARQCYDGIGSDVIASLFEHCGLVGSLDKRSLVSKLMCEGLTLLGNRKDFHRRNLVAFLRWVKYNNLGPTLCQFDFDYSLLSS